MIPRRGKLVSFVFSRVGRDTFVFDQGYVTKNQPITVLVLLSESLGI